LVQSKLAAVPEWAVAIRPTNERAVRQRAFLVIGISSGRCDQSDNHSGNDRLRAEPLKVRSSLTKCEASRLIVWPAKIRSRGSLSQPDRADYERRFRREHPTFLKGGDHLGLRESQAAKPPKG